MKLHLDTDLGGDIDDLCALAMLLKWPGVEITGITTVAEENGRRAGYTKYALKLTGREDIPVAAGADVSLGRYRFKPDYPNEEEYWPESIQPSPNPLGEALELLKRSIEQKAIVVGIGPFTNFALLDNRYPGILQGTNLYLMGGYVYPPRKGFPQWGNNMDYNVQVDVNSAKYVLENSNPVLIPLTVTIETALRRVYLQDLRSAGALGELIARQAEAYGRSGSNEEQFGPACEGLPDDMLNFQHDPLACAVALGWDGVKMSKVPLKLEVKDGWLYEYVNPAGKATRIVTEVDGNKFNEFWMELVTK
jgi:purine nucleosidase